MALLVFYYLVFSEKAAWNTLRKPHSMVSIFNLAFSRRKKEFSPHCSPWLLLTCHHRYINGMKSPVITTEPAQSNGVILSHLTAINRANQGGKDLSKPWPRTELIEDVMPRRVKFPCPFRFSSHSLCPGTAILLCPPSSRPNLSAQQNPPEPV